MAFSQENDGGSPRYKELYLALAFITRSPSVAFGASSLPEGAYVGVHLPTEIYGQINVGRCLGAAVANDLGKKRRE